MSSYCLNGACWALEALVRVLSKSYRKGSRHWKCWRPFRYGDGRNLRLQTESANNGDSWRWVFCHTHQGDLILWVHSPVSSVYGRCSLFHEKPFANAFGSLWRKHIGLSTFFLAPAALGCWKLRMFKCDQEDYRETIMKPYRMFFKTTDG